MPEHASERSRQAIEKARTILSQSKLKGMKRGGSCGGDADAKCDDATNVKCDDATRTCPAPAPAFPSQKEQGTAQGEVEEGEQHQGEPVIESSVHTAHTQCDSDDEDGTQFTRFTGTKAHILTQQALQKRWRRGRHM